MPVESLRRDRRTGMSTGRKRLVKRPVVRLCDRSAVKLQDCGKSYTKQDGSAMFPFISASALPSSRRQFYRLAGLRGAQRAAILRCGLASPSVPPLRTDRGSEGIRGIFRGAHDGRSNCIARERSATLREHNFLPFFLNLKRTFDILVLSHVDSPGIAWRAARCLAHRAAQLFTLWVEGLA